ncbi:MAG: HIRAN domain-containing protein [Clostridiales bacterium]|nr:HIRAN domain-containing protein [Clostridiales bacterium]
MENGLIKSKNDIIAMADAKGLGGVIKPLSREIYLFDTYVAGTTYLKDQSVLDEVKKGDKLILRREDNRFDELAILVLNESGKKLGYVPEKDNEVFARLMDAGKLLCGRIKSVDPRGSFRLINIEIYLVDF